MPEADKASPPRLDLALFRRLVELSQDVLWVLDADGNVVYCSPSVYALRGYTVEETMRQGMRDLVSGESYALAAARLESMRQGATLPNQRPIEMGLLRKDGSTVWAEVIADPIFEDGRLVGVIGITRDVSAEREAERRLREAKQELEQAVRAKDNFLASMSHEIRTPMNGILGTIELLLETAPSQEQRRYLETARSAGWALTALLDDVIAFSNSGTTGDELEPVGLAPPVAVAAGRTKTLSLLVAEDVEYNAKVVRALLEREGHRVTVVGNGAAAVAAANEGGFDAILMDVFMPEMDGVEATRRIRCLAGAAAEVPILGLTANILPQARAQYLAAGMDLVLLKPIEMAPLRHALAAVADGCARAAPVAAPAAAAADVVLDRTWLDEMLLVLPPPQVAELIGNAGLAIAEHLGEIEVRLTSADLPSLAAAAHRLAGLAAMYGCPRLRSIAVAVEDAARAGRSDKIGPTVDRLSGAVEEALAALDEVMGR